MKPLVRRAAHARIIERVRATGWSEERCALLERVLNGGIPAREPGDDAEAEADAGDSEDDEGPLVPLHVVAREIQSEIEAEQNRKLEVVSEQADRLQALISSGSATRRRR